MTKCMFEDQLSCYSKCNLIFIAFSESRFLFGVSSRMTLWEQISIILAILINVLVAFFYPFADGPGGTWLC